MKLAAIKHNSILTVLIIIVAIHVCQCISFNLLPRSKRCLKNEMKANELAVGDYEIASLPGTYVDISITDTKGHTAFQRENIDGKGKFAVTTDTADIYNLCFTYSKADDGVEMVPREVYVDLRVGQDAKQYDAIDDDKLNQLENGLTRIDDMTNSIITDFAYLKKREQEMRDTNDSTNKRLFFQGTLSIIIVLVLAAWQVLYLRTFWRRHKLID